MQDFWEWLVAERRQELVPQEVLDGYEHGFRRALEQLMGSVEDPILQDKFREMLDCPIKDSRGRCRSFTDYILAALVRHGIHKEADVEDVLSYVYQTMMHNKKVTGEPKATVFGSFDANRPYGSQGNPLEARFKVAVGNAIRNIAAGRIPRLFNVERRPQGTVSIGQGRGDQAGAISPDAIPARSDTRGLGELISDIKLLLQRKEAAYGLPITALFDSMMAGQNQAEQRKQFGDRATKIGRQVIVQTITDYAESSGNHYLLQLLRRLEEPQETLAGQQRVATKQASLPTWSSPKDQDFASIMQVVDKYDRPVGSADLGRHRRRWLQFPPRDANAGHSNRMAEVLSQMVRDGALQTVQTGRGGASLCAGTERREMAAGGCGVT